MLTAHEQGNHHVCDFGVGNGCAILVLGSHQVPDHVLLVFRTVDLGFSTRLDDAGVRVGDLFVCRIPFPVVWERRPRE